MPGYVLIIDLFGAILAGFGFTMAFRQSVIRRFIGGSDPAAPPIASAKNHEDPLTYVLRIAGIMMMAFGIAIGIMVTLFHLG
jgi:hypothetical protein